MALPSLPEAFIKEMDALIAEDEEANGLHSIEFQLGFVTAITFLKRLLEGHKPEVREEVMEALPTYASYKFIATMEEIGPRSSLQ